MLPHHLDIARPVADEEHVVGTLAEDLIGDVSVFSLRVVNFWSAHPRWPRMTAGVVDWRGLVSSASNISWVHFSFSCAKLPRLGAEKRCGDELDFSTDSIKHFRAGHE